MKERNQSTSAWHVWRDVITNPHWTPLETALYYAIEHLKGISEMEATIVYSHDGKRARLHMYSEDNSWNPKIASEWTGKTALLKHIQREINWFKK